MSLISRIRLWLSRALGIGIRSKPVRRCRHRAGRGIDRPPVLSSVPPERRFLIGMDATSDTAGTNGRGGLLGRDR